MAQNASSAAADARLFEEKGRYQRSSHQSMPEDNTLWMRLDTL